MDRQRRHMLIPDRNRRRPQQDSSVGRKNETGSADTIWDASVSTVTARFGRRRSNSPRTALAAALLENATRVHDPTDIGLCILKTRSMFRKRDGMPRSEIKSAGETAPPIAASHRECRISLASADDNRPSAAIKEAAPASPPTKK